MSEDAGKKKRPLGLGSLGSNKMAKTDSGNDSMDTNKEENLEAETMFQLPEGELSEEAEIRTIFVAAESAYADFRAMSEEELELESSKPDEENIQHKAQKLYAGVIHECDRLLKLFDAGERTEKISAEIYELLGDSLFKLRCCQRLDDLEADDEFLAAAEEKYDAGLEAFPGNVDLLVSKARLQLVKSILEMGDEDDSIEGISVPKLVHEGYQKNLQKIWQAASEFSPFLPEDNPQSNLAITRACLEMISEEIMLTVEEKLQYASWLAKETEVLFDLNPIEIETIEKNLSILEKSLASDEYPEEDIETQTTLGQLKAQMYLLHGSKYGLQGDEEKEQACYVQAHEVYRGLEEKFGLEIPDFILELVSSEN